MRRAGPTSARPRAASRSLRNNAEETFDVDQIQADIMSMPTAWEMSVASQIAQADIDTIQYLWEGGTITVDVTTGERTLPLGTPTVYRQKRLCVLFQRQSTDGGVTAGAIRAYCFRITQRTPQESSIVHNKTGDQVSIPFTWRCIADSTVQDLNARFGSPSSTRTSSAGCTSCWTSSRSSS
jgi:hypothetical protein